MVLGELHEQHLADAKGRHIDGAPWTATGRGGGVPAWHVRLPALLPLCVPVLRCLCCPCLLCCGPLMSLLCVSTAAPAPAAACLASNEVMK